MSVSQSCNNELPVNKEEMYELAHQAIATAEEFCFGANDRITEIAGNLRMGNHEQACDDFIGLIDDLHLITELLGDLKILLETDEKDLDSVQKLIEKEEKAFLSGASEIVEAQTREDWILLADLLEFELVPFISGLNETLIKVRKSI